MGNAFVEIAGAQTPKCKADVAVRDSVREKPVSWREVNPVYWQQRLRQAHYLPRRHPQRKFTAAELSYLRRTAAAGDLETLRRVVRRNLGRV